MKRLFQCAACALAICFTSGCVSNQAVRTDTFGIDQYTDGQEPARPYKQIGILGDNARLDEEPSITAKFLKKAEKMGGQGLILSKTADGSELTLSGIVQSYSYKGVVIVYK